MVFAPAAAENMPIATSTTPTLIRSLLPTACTIAAVSDGNHYGDSTIRPMKRYHVTTFGCQMNVHDSERIKGLLESVGLGEAETAKDADFLVFNTCTIREKADDRLVAHLMDARAAKQRDPDKVIVVGGCWSESMKDELFEQFPFVDLAFGPGNIHRLGDFVSAGGEIPRGHFSTFDSFAGELPLKRDRPHQAWLQISTGCNCNCSYCIVPSVRGREHSRHPDDLVREARALAADGVRELTLLGQNVNSYGRDLRPAVATSFADLLRALDAVPGIERIRFTSPHPKDMRADVIAAMAESPAVCEHLHLPVQSGSTRVLKTMRRTYSRERYLALVERIRAAIPAIALTTDIIVGFPGETEAEFAETLSLVDEVGYDHAFTFVYSPRRGTDAARMEEQVPDDVKKERIQRLVDRVQHHAAARNAALVGTVQEVLVEGPSRTDASVLRGRTRTNKAVNFHGAAAAGTLVDVEITTSTSQTLAGRMPAPVTV
jgi:tRNA-2-methylthio-N6-dimethylallyladenosine synthase